MTAMSLFSCKAKHCAALQDDMEGYNPKYHLEVQHNAWLCAALQDDMEGYNQKSAKKKKGRQEGLWGK